jgi:hypothetical protein
MRNGSQPLLYCVSPAKEKATVMWNIGRAKARMTNKIGKKMLG